ncbi:NPCBM/NEW2 domain-containing protein [uncultured Deinococcus sp.]|uniref:NPCBM/NEW2 domain-containing protein n=1 Tax=uncultured Deinococcus sp. TaxID=158789 RepID=UPI0025DC97FA|nr:NPCBM/NEW2 domain-containing protein [uncultured Deinococcus sp.]
MHRSPRRVLPTLLLSALLAACGQSPPPHPDDESVLPPGSPYANGAAYPWSDRLEAPVADPYAAGRDYPWSSPTAASTLDTQAVRSGVNELGDLPWTSATNFWGPVARNRSNGEQDVNDGRILTIGGKTYAKGLGVHADSSINYALNAQCSTFTASVGVDDEVGTRGRVTFQVVGDGRVLYTSPELTGVDAARAVTVAVTGVRELTLKVLKGANTYYDHADWAEARVMCQAPTPTGTVYVSDLAYTSATSNWGPVEIDASNGEQKQGDGRPLTIGQNVYARGLGVHANSTVTYDLGGACQAFTAVVGIDDETQGRGSAAFAVYGDGKLLYGSGRVPAVSPGTQEPPVIARADVTGVHALKLVVTDGGDGKTFDHADWADARLYCNPGRTAGTPDASFGLQGHATVGGVDSVVEPDSAVVLLGADFSVTRLSATGTLAGTGTVSVPGGTARALARQSNGTLVAVGEASGAVVAVRYLPNLQPDPSFGTGGVVVRQYGDTVNSVPAKSLATDVAVQSDGKVVLVGTLSRAYQPYPDDNQSTLDHLIARLNPDGTPDTGFGASGTIALATSAVSSTTCGELEDVMSAVAIQADGKIVATGNSDCTGGYIPLILRVGSTGQLDPSFSGDGLAYASVVSGGYGDFIRAVVIQPDGRIVIGGATERFQTAAFVERLTQAGAPDGGRTFQIADEFYEQGSIFSLAAQADGKIVFGARSPNSQNLGRLNADLTLDTAFGSQSSGYVTVTEAITSVNVDPLGRIVGSGPSGTVRVLP